MKQTICRRIYNRLIEKVRNKKVLFVGVADYTQDEVKWLEDNNVEVWSIDINPDKKKYGSKKHLVGSIGKLDKIYYDYFDVVIMLGVIGFGVNSYEDIIKSFQEVRKVLRKDGTFLVSFGNNEELKI